VSARGEPFGQNGDMNRPSGGNGDLARGAGAAAMKGAALIGLAVIVGVFLLQRADTTKTGAAGAPAGSSAKTTTTARRPSETTTSTTQPATPRKTPDQLKVLVLNGGAPTGAAALLRTKLLQVGYTNQPPAGTWTGHSQTGKTVICKNGLGGEAVALSQQTALSGARVAAFPTPAPPSSADVDCVVVVGH
jgi:LytR cell envelope-related transcriptional attenuator